MKSILILYHKNCPDGFGGAWAAWKKFGNKAEYLAVEHQTPLPKNLSARKEIYMVDFCYSYPIMQKLLAINLNVIVIDHHISAEKAVKLSKKYSYYLNNSGSVLAWKYFHRDKKIPKLLKHIEDVDLWKFKIPFTKEVMAALDLEKFDFKKWDKIALDLEDKIKRKKYIVAGKILLKYREKLIERMVNGAEKAKLGKHNAFAVNSSVLVSEIGNSIVKKHKTIGIIWARKSGKIIVSLRSNGKKDVSKIASKYGGGGHKAASGFKWDVKKPLPWE